MKGQKRELTSNYYDSRDLLELGIGGCGQNVLISQQSVLVGIENLIVGDNVRIDSFVLLLASRNTLSIGSNVHIEPHSSLVAHHGITIGNSCTISHGVRLFTASADYSGASFTNRFPEESFQKPKIGPIIISDHVIIGANSVVMPNVQLKEGAAVGALSFVRDSLDPWQIYAGNPLRVLGPRVTEVKNTANKFLSLEQ